MATADSKIAKYLLDNHLLDQFQYQAVQDHQDKADTRFHLAIIDLGFVPEDRVVAVLSKVAGIPRVALDKLQVDPKAIAALDGEFCTRNRVFPCALRDGGQTLWLAMADPLTGTIAQEARRLTGLQLRVLVAGPSEIAEYIQRYYGEELGEANPFASGGIDLSLSDEEADDEDVFKVTDMSGHTLVKHTGEVRREGAAAAKLASQMQPEAPHAAATPGVDLTVDTQGPAVTIEQRLARIASNQEKAARIIKALVKNLHRQGILQRRGVRPTPPGLSPARATGPSGMQRRRESDERQKIQ